MLRLSAHPEKIEATLLEGYSPCCMLLGVVAQSLKAVKRLAACKRRQQLPAEYLYPYLLNKDKL